MFTLVFACLGLISFTNEATAKLAAVPAQIARVGFYEYCPAERDTEAEDALADQTPAPVQESAPDPGCALVKRAFELGYAKTLGDCAPKVLEKKADRVAAAAAPCVLRQRDEPLLHYTWRLLTQNTSGAAEADPADWVDRSLDRFDTQLGYLDSLFAQQTHAVTASPHAAHHLWTNLPNPDPSATGFLARTFSSKNCTDRYDGIVPRPIWHLEPEPPSAMVDHVFGQLIFNPLFGQTPGNCREYTVHWNAQNDACAELIDDPIAFLTKHEALGGVRDVLDRHYRQGELHQLALDLDREPLVDSPPDARAFESFQCFMIDPEGTGTASGVEIEVDGVTLAAREVRTPEFEANGASHLRVYQQMASLFAGGGYSGPVVTNVSAKTAERPPIAEDLEGDGFLLTKLENIRDADPFLGTEWPLERDDLIEVYPMHRHLDSFIRAFRQRYWAQRGRL